MKVLKRKMLNVLIAFVMVFSFAFSGWGGIFTAISVKAETALVNLTFNTLGLNGGENNDNTFGGTNYYTCIRFTTGVFSGDANGAFDFSDLTEKASYVGSGNTDGQWGFAPAYSKWAQGYKNDAVFNFIYLWTANKPASDDTIAMKAGSYFTFSGTFADGTGECDDKYVLTEDINLKFNGTAWETYVPAVDNTQFVTEFTNNGQFVVDYYLGNATSYPYEIVDGSTEALPAGYTGAVAKIGSKINSGAAYINIDFTASQISAADVESVVARVYSPDYTADDQLRINNVGGYIASADLSNWCDVVIPVANITGNDGNLGSFAFGLRDKGTVSDYFYIDSITVNMVKPVEPIDVTFTHINSDWNNNSATLGNGMYYTVLHISGLTSSGYYTQGDDWTDMTAKATINGEASYFSFCPASFIAGPNVSADFIVMYSATAPTVGDEFFVPAGTTFKVGGNDTNIYELTNDINLKFNGTAWAEPVKATYSVYENMDPEIIHTYSTTQNADGSFTYTLPEYEREGKVLLGYVMNLMVDEELTQTFLPSGEYTTTATGCVFIALWGEFTTIDGASIRISSAETSGIRWTTNIDSEGFNNIAYWATNGFTFGTELSADGFAENFDIVAKTWKVENSQYTGVLTDINSDYYTQEFTARGYVDITYHNGVTKRIYAIANDTTRSIKEVAEKAIASGDYSGTQLSILKQIAGV